nr:hypothetical protein [uncultured bacterium]
MALPLHFECSLYHGARKSFDCYSRGEFYHTGEFDKTGLTIVET